MQTVVSINLVSLHPQTYRNTALNTVSTYLVQLLGLLTLHLLPHREEERRKVLNTATVTKCQSPIPVEWNGDERGRESVRWLTSDLVENDLLVAMGHHPLFKLMGQLILQQVSTSDITRSTIQ